MRTSLLRKELFPSRRGRRRRGVLRAWVEAEFLADVRERDRVGQARVGHHGTQGWAHRLSWARPSFATVSA